MRQNIELQNELEPKRMVFAINEIEKLGLKTVVWGKTRISFEFNGSNINFFPYSGWASGATIKDGRGIKKLLKQIK